MFDASTAALIREAPAISGVNPETLPQELTSIYAELTIFRSRGIQPASEESTNTSVLRLKRIADVYEAAVDTGTQGDARRAAAFVSATAHQILERIEIGGYEAEAPLLAADAISPSIAAPLLFLIAEQNADAREAARVLRDKRSDTLLHSAVIESIYDLATENFQSILNRAGRLQRQRVSMDDDWLGKAEDALFGLCWTGIVQLVSQLIGGEMPALEFARADTALQTFGRVVSLSTQELQLGADVSSGSIISSYAGPRHLARLLGHVAGDYAEAGIMKLNRPGGAMEPLWGRWLRHRAQSKPILWRNHREAIETGILDAGQSAVLILPTGAGKTTLSELKVAATVARGKKVLFLVPTLALVDQLRDELEETFPPSLGQVEVSSDGDLTGLISGAQLGTIEVMTPERCLALLSHAADAVEDVGLIVFDECHLLSPAGGGTRSLDAMLCLLHALKRAPDADMLLLSAMLTNANEFAEWIQESTARPCTAYQNSWKPSRQARGVVAYRRQDLANISSSQTVIPHALFGLQQNWNPGSNTDYKLIQLSSDAVRLNRSSKTGRATPNANGVSNVLAASMARVGLKVIVFVQQAGYAPKNAADTSDILEAGPELNAAEEILWLSILAELGGAQYSMVQPRRAALPHNGDMISQERRLAESLFKRDGGASVIVATPTLAQGMNLPAQVAILAGDRRLDEDGGSPLQAHEILNAAGRAGRAGHMANGIVLLIPYPVVGFRDGDRPEAPALSKLRALLPPSDQCVAMDGLPDQALQAAQTRLAADISTIPSSVEDWIDWIVDFFADDPASYSALMGGADDVVRYIVRGKKTGGDVSLSEFNLLKAALRAWVTGAPFCDIERALGVAENKIKCCPRTRDLVLKLANRRFYLVAGSIVDVAQLVYRIAGAAPPRPACLETLAVCVRKGLRSADQVAFAHWRPHLRSRVVIQRAYTEEIGTPLNTDGMDYAAVRSQINAQLAFSAVSL